MRRIEKWKERGYFITLVFVTLRDADLAVERVGQRVSLGGHHIPPDVIRRRFEGGLRNFKEIYRDLVDDWVLVDNSGETHVMMEWK